MSKRLVGTDGTAWDCAPKTTAPGDTMITYTCRRADEPRSEPRYIRVPIEWNLDDPAVAMKAAPTIP